MPGLKRVLQRCLNGLGYEVRRIPTGGHTFPADFDQATRDIISAVRPFTMTSDEALATMIESTRHITRHRIPGQIVECGTWRGGSTMAAARTLLQLGDSSRRLYLFDTYEGMTKPGDRDRSPISGDARKEFKVHETSEVSSDWCRSSIDEVRGNLRSTGYPEDRTFFIKGTVEQTLPQSYDGGAIALLRLDTDWYESTRHELVHLYPLLSPGGILIIDDYGHWEGARQACDEYFAEHPHRAFLHRVDYTVRLLVKPG
jgi:predicted O-methyltransferase YrrM